jgi:Lon protease-like protein
MTIPREGGATIERLALFPLPKLVLFPGALLPLHIFEPRYRAMTADLLRDDLPLAVVMIVDGEPIDANGHPPIASVSGVGDIVRHERLADGRYNILVQGRARVALEELPFEPPYRRASATVLASRGHATQADMAALFSSATRFISRLSKQSGTPLRLPASEDAGAVADACAHHLIVEPAERQRLLETLEVGERVRRCSELLAVQEALLAGGGRPS